jgi:hypothetical protein
MPADELDFRIHDALARQIGQELMLEKVWVDPLGYTGLFRVLFGPMKTWLRENAAMFSLGLHKKLAILEASRSLDRLGVVIANAKKTTLSLYDCP